MSGASYDNYESISSRLKRVSLKGISLWGMWLLDRPLAEMESRSDVLLPGALNGLPGKVCISARAALLGLFEGDLVGASVRVVEVSELAPSCDALPDSRMALLGQPIQAFFSDLDVFIAALYDFSTKATRRTISSGVLEEKNAIINDMKCSYHCCLSLLKENEKADFAASSLTFSDQLAQCLPWTNADPIDSSADGNAVLSRLNVSFVFFRMR